MLRARRLDGDDLAGVDFDAQEDGVFADKGSAVEQLVGDEPREAEAEGVRFGGWPLKVLPGGVGNEGFGNAALAAEGALLEEGEGDGVREGPLEQGVVLSGQDLDVDGHVGGLAGAVSVEEHRGLQLVAVLASVEGRRDQLEAVLALGLDHLGGPVGDLPEQRSGVVGAQLGHGVLQHGDLLTLTAR